MGIKIVIVLLFAVNVCVTNSLKVCGTTNITTRHICTTDKKYVISDSGHRPMNLFTSMTLFSISELNEDTRVMTLNVLMSAVWNDTRLTLESSEGVK
jgi:hypothetical protein